LDEGEERSEEQKRNPTILGKSILEEPERKMEDVTSRSSNRTKECNPKVFKISCTIKEKLLTDGHIDPSSPVNTIPLSLYHEAFPKCISCKKVMKDLSIRIRIKAYLLEDKQISSVRVYDKAKNEPLLGGHLSPELNLFDQILP
jgi:hypothetical protein